MPELVYRAEPTLAKFHQCNVGFYRGVMGPVRSGKSTGMTMEIMKRSMEQKAGGDKVRRTKWAVVRNTYRELMDTTLKTWLMWFPEEVVGKFNYGIMTHRIRFSDVQMEVLFRALDRPEDVGKLGSLELTGAWVNEAREVPKIIIDTLGDRVGQYPSKAMGGCTWRGVMMDTNPPDTSHWWYRLAEEQKPRGWYFWKQPGALKVDKEGKYIPNPDAENIGNLNEGMGYYLDRVSGKSPDHIKVYYCGEYGFVIDGKAVYWEYADAAHCWTEEIKPVKGLNIYVGLDFGLTPAAVFGQRLPSGRWVVLDELVSERMGSENFGKILGPKLRQEYGDCEIDIYGDPSGDTMAQTDERTPFMVLNNMGIPAKPAPSNDFGLRRDAVGNRLAAFIDGKPGLIISPKCKTLRKAMAGGYAFKKVAVAGEERFQEKPDKNSYSHVAEALQYMLMGAGEGATLIKAPARKNSYHIGPINHLTPVGTKNDSAWMIV